MEERVPAPAPETIAKYEPVIGLEVHAQLLTTSKAFSAAAMEFGPTPNTNTDPVILGHPGTLPTVNRRLVEFSIRMGIATNCSIRLRNTFARKNYFYPDLPKGYQISQYDQPICYDGWIDIEPEEGRTHRVRLERIHMEEDTGKMIHDLDPSHTLVDHNRTGSPLIEIVTRPDIRSAADAYLYLVRLKSILTYLDICSGNMEDGALRCDANVSVRPKGSDTLGTKAEVKNLNSFRGVEKAIEYEILRQIELIESGGRVEQETRQWDAVERVTRPMRSKEFAHDYRYFPEPDLPPVVITEEQLEQIRADLPELAQARKERFTVEYALPSYDAGVLTESRALGDYFEAVVNALKEKDERGCKLVSNIIMTEVLRTLTDRKIDVEEFPIEAGRLAGLVDLFAADTISSKNVKDIFAEMLSSPHSAEEISREKGYVQISDTSFLEEAVDAVLAENSAQVEAYRGGKENLFGFFVGQTMKKTRGKANPKMVNDILKLRLQ